MASGISLFSLIFSTKLFMLSISVLVYDSLCRAERGRYVRKPEVYALLTSTDELDVVFIQPIEMLPIVEATVKIDLL
jgi:hypothetical protein